MTLLQYSSCARAALRYVVSVRHGSRARKPGTKSNRGIIWSAHTRGERSVVLLLVLTVYEYQYINPDYTLSAQSVEFMIKKYDTSLYCYG